MCICQGEKRVVNVHAVFVPDDRAYGRALGLTATSPDLLKLLNYTDPSKTAAYRRGKASASSATGDFGAVLHEVLVAVRWHHFSRDVSFVQPSANIPSASS